MIAVLSAWDQQVGPSAEMTAASKEAYCERHGYTAHMRPGVAGWPWAKVDAIRTAMAGGAEWVLWLDADAGITNPTVRIEDLIPSAPAEWVVTTDINGLNAGVLLIRNTLQTRQFLDLWDGCGLRYATHPNQEQTALAHLLYRLPLGVVTVAPQRSMNSYRHAEYGMTYDAGEWRPGDFVLHLPGLPAERRAEIFSEVLLKV